MGGKIEGGCGQLRECSDIYNSALWKNFSKREEEGRVNNRKNKRGGKGRRTGKRKRRVKQMRKEGRDVNEKEQETERNDWTEGKRSDLINKNRKVSRGEPMLERKKKEQKKTKKLTMDMKLGFLARFFTMGLVYQRFVVDMNEVEAKKLKKICKIREQVQKDISGNGK